MIHDLLLLEFLVVYELVYNYLIVILSHLLHQSPSQTLLATFLFSSFFLV